MKAGTFNAQGSTPTSREQTLNAQPSSQLAFDLRLPAGRPLVPIEAVMVLLDRDEDDVMNLIDTGALRCAWNIASPGSERREIRVWRDSVLAYLKGQPTNAKEEINLRAIIKGFLPAPTLLQGWSTIRGVEIARRLSCSQWLVGNLITTGELHIAFPVADKVSPYVQHNSLVEFLIRREMSRLGKGTIVFKPLPQEARP